jgi:UDP-N-acetylglucosamine 2-epimerase (non-hydrolysing)
MKIAPLYHALSKTDWAEPIIVHTGQHHDPLMSDVFLDDLRLPTPDVNLGVGSGSHAETTAAVMVAYERFCREMPPNYVVVVGDVNSTVAAALVAKKLLLPVAHLEAGLRSLDRTMPEEINRLVTDAISDLLWTPSEDADENLAREGVPPQRIDRIGNIMIDSYEMLRARIKAADMPAVLGLKGGPFGVVTLHRPSNVDSPQKLAMIMKELAAISRNLPLVFPVHPRTRNRLGTRIEDLGNISLIEPMGYVQFMSLLEHTSLVITDSGGVQEETSYLGIPCLTLRENTERPITITRGTNRLVRPAQLVSAAEDALSVARSSAPVTIPLWDGHTAERAVASLYKHVGVAA